MTEITIRKADGNLEVFQVEKLKNSLKSAGASPEEVIAIIAQIEPHLFDGITTEALYRNAFELLRKSENTSAARYSLRRAMIGLGPTGFPFEDYLARLFEKQGYRTKTRSVLQGKCVSHEVDIVAYKENENFIAEAKYHMQPGIKSDLQVILYSHARFLDILAAPTKKKATDPITQAWVITNTKFTTTAIQYAKCAGVHLLSWDYPKKNNLHDIIERTKMYPITVLQTLSEKDKRALLQAGVVVCSDIIDNGEVLSSIGVPRKKISAIMAEGARLCTIK